MYTLVITLWKRAQYQEGQALVEYALLISLIALVAIGALHFLGGSVSNTLNHIANSLNAT